MPCVSAWRGRRRPGLCCWLTSERPRQEGPGGYGGRALHQLTWLGFQRLHSLRCGACGALGSWGPGFLLWSLTVESLAGLVCGRLPGRSRMREAGSVSGDTRTPAASLALAVVLTLTPCLCASPSAGGGFTPFICENKRLYLQLPD